MVCLGMMGEESSAPSSSSSSAEDFHSSLPCSDTVTSGLRGGTSGVHTPDGISKPASVIQYSFHSKMMNNNNLSSSSSSASFSSLPSISLSYNHTSHSFYPPPSSFSPPSPPPCTTLLQALRLVSQKQSTQSLSFSSSNPDKRDEFFSSTTSRGSREHHSDAPPSSSSRLLLLTAVASSLSRGQEKLRQQDPMDVEGEGSGEEDSPSPPPRHHSSSSFSCSSSMSQIDTSKLPSHIARTSSRPRHLSPTWESAAGGGGAGVGLSRKSSRLSSAGSGSSGGSGLGCIDTTSGGGSSGGEWLDDMMIPFLSDTRLRRFVLQTKLLSDQNDPEKLDAFLDKALQAYQVTSSTSASTSLSSSSSSHNASLPPPSSCAPLSSQQGESSVSSPPPPPASSSSLIVSTTTASVPTLGVCTPGGGGGGLASSPRVSSSTSTSTTYLRRPIDIVPSPKRSSSGKSFFSSSSSPFFTSSSPPVDVSKKISPPPSTTTIGRTVSSSSASSSDPSSHEIKSSKVDSSSSKGDADYPPRESHPLSTPSPGGISSRSPLTAMEAEEDGGEENNEANRRSSSLLEPLELSYLHHKEEQRAGDDQDDTVGEGREEEEERKKRDPERDSPKISSSILREREAEDAKMKEEEMSKKKMKIFSPSVDKPGDAPQDIPSKSSTKESVSSGHTASHLLTDDHIAFPYRVSIEKEDDGHMAVDIEEREGRSKASGTRLVRREEERQGESVEGDFQDASSSFSEDGEETETGIEDERKGRGGSITERLHQQTRSPLESLKKKSPRSSSSSPRLQHQAREQGQERREEEKAKSSSTQGEVFLSPIGEDGLKSKTEMRKDEEFASPGEGAKGDPDPLSSSSSCRASIVKEEKSESEKTGVSSSSLSPSSLGSSSTLPESPSPEKLSLLRREESENEEKKPSSNASADCHPPSRVAIEEERSTKESGVSSSSLALHKSKTLLEYIRHQRKALSLQPTSHMSEKALRLLKEVFDKHGDSGAGGGISDLNVFAQEIVVPLLGLGEYMAPRIFAMIDRHDTGTISLPMIKEFWSDRLILACDDPTTFGEGFPNSKLPKFFLPAASSSSPPPPDHMSAAEGEDENRSASFLNEELVQHTVKRGSARNFFHIVKQEGCDYITPEDLRPWIDDVLRYAPDMSFLNEPSAVEFASRYVDSVIARIMFEVDRDDSGHISFRDLKNSCLPHVWFTLTPGIELSVVRRFFSYEHFYLFYCTFHALDEDEDFLLDRSDVRRYDNHNINIEVEERVFQQVARTFKSPKAGYMCFEDWIWFLLVYHDVTSEHAIEFWFKIFDIDGDGVLRDHEIEVFFNAQVDRFRMRDDKLPAYRDFICPMCDALCVPSASGLRCEDLLRDRTSGGCFISCLLKRGAFQAMDEGETMSSIVRGGFIGGSLWDRHMMDLTPFEIFASQQYQELTSRKGEECFIEEGGGYLDESDGSQSDESLLVDTASGDSGESIEM